jgi:hypothetical protein
VSGNASDGPARPTRANADAPQTADTEEGRAHPRGQSAIIGVALLLGLTIVSVGVLTAGTGILVDEAAKGADAKRVADRMATAYNPSTLEGSATLSLALTGGQVSTAERRITVRRFGDVVAAFDTNVLQFEEGNHQVTVIGQAIVRGQAGRARFVRTPRLVTLFGSDGDRTLSISIVALAGRIDQTVTNQEPLRLHLNGSHDRRNPGAGRYTISIETATPGIWQDYLTDIARSVRIVGDDSSGTKLVVAELGRVSRARLIVHRVEVEPDG